MLRLRRAPKPYSPPRAYPDVRGGEFTFGNRIEVGRVMSDAKLTDLERLRGVMTELVPGWKLVNAQRDLLYYLDVMEVVQQWAEREKKFLHREPSDLQKRAGVARFSERFGQFPTLIALAERFKLDPDTILDWRYAKVFNILVEDLERSEYLTRLSKLQDQQAREKAKANKRR